MVHFLGGAEEPYFREISWHVLRNNGWPQTLHKKTGTQIRCHWYFLCQHSKSVTNMTSTDVTRQNFAELFSGTPTIWKLLIWDEEIWVLLRVSPGKAGTGCSEVYLGLGYWGLHSVWRKSLFFFWAMTPCYRWFGGTSKCPEDGARKLLRNFITLSINKTSCCGKPYPMWLTVSFRRCISSLWNRFWVRFDAAGEENQDYSGGLPSPCWRALRKHWTITASINYYGI